MDDVRIGNVFFSDYFNVSRDTIKEHGAIDISLINDTPLFVDPFLIFESEKEEYQVLHTEITKYLRFLQSRQFVGDKGEFDRLLHFDEVKQTWLGFSLNGNAGLGLGRQFADALIKNISNIIPPKDNDLGIDIHLEKLCLLGDGIGNDKVSDFTTNLIKIFLAEYTQQFAIKNIDSALLREVPVDKAVFDYNTRRWKPKVFTLPFHSELNDYVLLTPRDILTKSDLWINNKGLYDQFIELPDRISNEQLRDEINEYISSLMPNSEEEPSKEDLQQLYSKVMKKYPILIDAYIKSREDDGYLVFEHSLDEVAFVEDIYSDNAKHAIGVLNQDTLFYTFGDFNNSYDEAMSKIDILKDNIENNDLYRMFYDKDGKRVQGENGLQRLYKLIWSASKSKFDVNPETNHGRGPVDFAVSYGSNDKTIVEFKIASNTKLESNLSKQLDVYAAADISSKKPHKICVITCFSDNDFGRARDILDRLELDTTSNIILIDARNDNKPSGSNA
ncbi:MAG: hypothetical protein LBM97_01070 [Candidatus Nomurabacteria bacterium]|jgi:hypothetical protein|nr:hypothetical protein [Candidatus Nomurabacteria bacterium]